MTQDQAMGRSITSGAAHADNNEKLNQQLNSFQNPRAVSAVLMALAKAGTLGKLREGAAT